MLCGVAQAVPVLDDGVAAEGEALQETAVPDRVEQGSLPYLPVQITGCHCHAVLGQGAGLVRADDADAAQSLHAWQTLDDGIYLHHAGDA